MIYKRAGTPRRIYRQGINRARARAQQKGQTDSPKTLFYCDPPYLHATRGDAKAYGFEMDESQHREFAEAVNECKGMVAVSGYDHPLMDELFKPGRWFKTQGPDKTIHSTKGKRSEVLWTNYDPKNQRLFAF
jgi:DNA adenine methylase